MGWIGFDLDGTLALWGWDVDPLTGYRHYDVLQIGPPIVFMVERCKALIAEGQEVRIFTARVGPATDEEYLASLKRIPGYEPSPTPRLDWHNYQTTLIENWCREHIGQVLPITATKDFHMYLFYDDRCVQVVSNTGRTVEEELEEWKRRALQNGAEAV